MKLKSFLSSEAGEQARRDFKALSQAEVEALREEGKASHRESRTVVQQSTKGILVDFKNTFDTVAREVSSLPSPFE